MKYKVDENGYITVPGFQPYYCGLNMIPDEYDVVTKDDGNTYIRLTPDVMLTPSP